MTVAERIAAYKKLLDAVLSAGPDIQDDLTDLTLIRDAAIRIAQRSAKRFGMGATEHEDILGETQWQEIRADSEVQTLEQQVKAVAPAHVMGAGPSDKAAGPLMDILMQLFQVILQNPALLQLILTLFKKPA